MHNLETTELPQDLGEGGGGGTELPSATYTPPSFPSTLLDDLSTLPHNPGSEWVPPPPQSEEIIMYVLTGLFAFAGVMTLAALLGLLCSHIRKQRKKKGRSKSSSLNYFLFSHSVGDDDGGDGS